VFQNRHFFEDKLKFGIIKVVIVKTRYVSTIHISGGRQQVPEYEAVKYYYLLLNL